MISHFYIFFLPVDMSSNANVVNIDNTSKSLMRV